MSDDEAFEAIAAIRFAEDGGEASARHLHRALRDHHAPQVEVPGLRSLHALSSPAMNASNSVSSIATRCFSSG